MKNKKITKGSFGYISYCKKREILKTALLFLIPLSLFAAGWITTKSRLNVLTIVAVLGMLPASKSAVLMIMYLKGHGISREEHDLYAPLMEGMTGSFDLIFTTYEKTYEIPALVIRCGNIVGISAGAYETIRDLEKHIEHSVRQEGYSVCVKFFDKKEAYMQRLGSLAKLEESEADAAADLAIRQVLFDISL